MSLEGILSYLVFFVTMAGIYAVLCSGNNKGAIAGGYIVWAIAALFRQK